MLKLGKVTMQYLFIIYVLVNFLSFISGLYWLFFGVFVVSTSLMILKGISFFRKTEDLERQKRSYKNSIIFMFFLFISILAVVIRNLQEIIAAGQLFLGMLFMLFSVAFLFISLLVYFKNVNINFSNILSWFKTKIVLFLISIVIIALSFDAWMCYPIWDTADYYNWLTQINISTFNDLYCLKLCYHSSVAYSIIVYIISCFMGNLYNAVIVFNILFCVLSLFAVYTLINKICPNCGKIFPYIASIVFVFSPFIFGFLGYVYNDLAAVYGIVLFLCAVSVRQKDFIFLTVLNLIFTKEVGLLVAVSVIALPLLIKFIIAIRNRNFKKFFRQILNTYYVCLLLLFLSWIIVFCLSFGEAGGWHYFGFNFAHIVTVLKTLLLTNFTWVFLLFIVCAVSIVCVDAIRKKRSGINVLKCRFIPILVTFLVTLFFNALCVTWEHVRYLMPEIICLYLLGFVAVNYACKSFKIKIVKQGVLLIILPVFIVSCYITIDPFMLNSNAKFRLGGYENYYMIAAGYRDRNLSEISFNDNVVYNKQIIGAQLMLDEVLKTIDYDDSKCLVFGDGAVQRGLASFGDATGFKWDKVASRRIITNNKIDKINVIKLENTEETKEKLVQGAYTYYFLDFYAENNAKVLDYIDGLENFSVEHVDEVYGFGWHATVSKLKIV